MNVEFKYKYGEYSLLQIKPPEDVAFVYFEFDDGMRYSHSIFKRLWVIIRFIFTGKFKLLMLEDKHNK